MRGNSQVAAGVEAARGDDATVLVAIDGAGLAPGTDGQ